MKIIKFFILLVINYGLTESTAGLGQGRQMASSFCKRHQAHSVFQTEMVLDHGRAPKWSFINWLTPIRIWLTLARTLDIGHSFTVWWSRTTARVAPQMCGNIAEMHPKQINRKQSKHDRPHEKGTSWQNCWSKQNRVLVINDTMFQRIPTLAETAVTKPRAKKHRSRVADKLETGVVHPWSVKVLLILLLILLLIVFVIRPQYCFRLCQLGQLAVFKLELT